MQSFTNVDGEPFTPHLVRFLVLGAIMSLSVYILVGVFWYMHAARRTGFRARDVVFGSILVLPMMIWSVQIVWRYSAKSMYWSTRPEHHSESLFS